MSQIPPRMHRLRLSSSGIPNIAKPNPSDGATAKRNVHGEADTATAAFIRRTLCAHHVGDALVDEKGIGTSRPLDELLPPLTSSNEVDLQLYAILAVVLRDSVQSWYTKITPDHVFVDEVIQVIAHCTRALEERFRNVDLEALLLDEIPELVDDHVKAYRTAHATPTKLSPPLCDPRRIYHTLHPHPALSPVPVDSEPLTIREQYENEADWRQLLVQGVLAVLLPTEDLENTCLRSLVGEILAESVLGNGIGGKLSESWLLWESITKAIEAIKPRVIEDDATADRLEDAGGRLERFGLLSSQKQVPAVVAMQAEAGNDQTQQRQEGGTASMATGLWQAMRWMVLASTWIRVAVVSLATASSLPGRTGETPSIKRPIVAMRVWSLLNSLLELDVCMPWLVGALSLGQWASIAGPGKFGDTDGAVDRLLSHNLHQGLAQRPSLLPDILRVLRAALFPNNAPAPPRAVPSADECSRIKRRCADAVLAAVPEPVAARLFGGRASIVTDQDKRRHRDGEPKNTTINAPHDKREGHDGQRTTDEKKHEEAQRAEHEREREHELELRLRQIERLLDVLADSYMNKHLLYAVVERLALRLIPELAASLPTELLRSRLGDVAAAGGASS